MQCSSHRNTVFDESSVVDSFDVVVIGGGPAGAAAAFTAAQSGLRTVVVDKSVFPRDKLCGGLFSGRARTCFTDAFGADIDESIFQETSQVEFWYRRECIGQLSDVPPLFLTMRRDLDVGMLRRALAVGAVDLTGHRIAEIDLVKKQVTLGSGRILGWQVLIGADGVNSQVARSLFGSAYRTETIGFALEIEAPPPQPGKGAPVRIDFAAADGGYGWSFPKSRSTTIGIGGPFADNPDMRARMSEYLALFDLTPGQFALKGHFIPCGDFRKSPGRGAVLLCGDAAGLVDPVTGEGIAYAIQSGQFAGQSAIAALKRNQPDCAFATYVRQVKKIHRSLRIARIIRPILFASLMEQTLAQSFRASSTLKGLYMQVLGGQAEYTTLLRAVIARLPRLAVSMLRARM